MLIIQSVQTGNSIHWYKSYEINIIACELTSVSLVSPLPDITYTYGTIQEIEVGDVLQTPECVYSIATMTSDKFP